MRNLVAATVIMLAANSSYAQNANDTFEVYFPLREAKVTKQATGYIDSLIFKDRLIHGQKFILLGYADYVGGNPLNDVLSRERAKNVQAYLATMGFDKNDITLCVGKGKIGRQPVNGMKGYAADRKVQIIIDKQIPAVAPAAVVMDISKAKVNETVTLKNILFEGGTNIFLHSSMAALDDLLKELNEHKTMHVGIEGHICCVGEPTVGRDDLYNNMPLSAARAKAVYDFLVAKGIDRTRLSYKGLGNLGPLAYPEITEDDKMKNRRVDVRVLSK